MVIYNKYYRIPDIIGTAFLAVAVITLIVSSGSNALAGQFRVSPIRLDFDRKAKSGVITVTNDSDEKMRIQVEALEWTQDGEGKDQYGETADIIFFPKLVSIDAGERQIIRAGIKTPAVDREKTYRLFLKEIPEGRPGQAGVSIAIRFGVPIFVSPIEKRPLGKIVDAGLRGGELGVDVHNPGNVYFLIKSVSAEGRNNEGQTVYAETVNGWYLLSGASRVYRFPVPPDKCPEIRSLDITVETDEFDLKRRIDVDETMCAQ